MSTTPIAATHAGVGLAATSVRFLMRFGNARQGSAENARFADRKRDDALDASEPARHSQRMAYVRFILVIAACLWVSGCASGPTGPVLAYPPASSARPNGQPKMFPCMIGDPLCTPQT